MRYELSAALAFGAAIVFAAPFADESAEPHFLRTRNIVDDIADSYDFVVVGGGLAGLVLGGRLSEDSNHTVLVLEAGTTGEEFQKRIDTPGYSYYQSLWPTSLNWNFNTTPQANANNSELPWPRGKVLGGSSAINGMYMNRPGKIEIDAWNDMLGDMDGADSWTWDSFYAALKKSEAFSPPTDAVAQEAGITWDSSSHGTKGPIHMSYPGYTFPLVSQWLSATDSVGIANSDDTYSGENWGAYVATSAINPTNWTRSYSRSGYLDPLPPRPNYDVLTSAYVTRVLFNSSSPKDNLTANAVEYTRDNGATKLTVKVKKEVILAGGTIGSPAVLLYSGVGPKDVLSAAGVEVVSELPGVGQHLQDHLSITVQFATDQETAGYLYASNGSETDDAAFLSYVNSAVAYVNSSVLFGSGTDGIHSSILSQADQFTSASSSDAGVVAGNKAIYTTTADDIFTSPIGLLELLIGNNINGTVNIGAALQHPYSHGRIYINSSNPVDYPVIDPNYLAHPVDVQTLLAGVKLVRRIGESGPFKDSLQKEVWPGTEVESDEDLEEWLRGSVFTEFHPSSTCAMLPLKQGGVVDANLRVYGLSNVRVADASVPPISFSAHLMASTYGLAEQASTIIRTYHNHVIPKKSNTTASNNTSSSDNDSSEQSSNNSTGNSNSTSSGDSNGSDGRPSLHPWPVLLAFAACIASMVLF